MNKIELIYLWCMFLCVFGNYEGDSNVSTQLSDELNTNWEKYTSPQINGFQDSLLTTGPIVLVNSRKLFLTDIDYTATGKDEEISFYIVDTNGDYTYLKTPDVTSLHKHNGQNIDVNIPSDKNLNNVLYFGLWDVAKNESVTFVYVNVTGIPEENTVDDGKFILRLPKCCPFDQSIIPGKCEGRSNKVEIENFQVLEHNETHLDDDPINPSKYRIIPYYYLHPCKKTFAPVDKVYVLKNTSIILSDEASTGLKSSRDYCIESIGNQTNMTIFYCIEEVAVGKMANFFLILTIISTICFGFTSFWYWFVLTVKDVHKKCFVIYSVSMTASFLLLTILQLNPDNCDVMGGFFIFFTMFSYIMLVVLFVDLYYIIKFVCDVDSNSKKRLYIYLITTTLTASIITITSVFDGSADVPHSFIKSSQSNLCTFEGSNIFFFFIPILISIIICIVFVGLTKREIGKLDLSCLNDPNHFWSDTKTSFKFMWRQATLLSCLMLLFSLSEFLSTITNIDSFNISMTALALLIGFFNSCLSLGHFYGNNLLEERRMRIQSTRKNRQLDNENNDTEMVPLN